MGLISLISGLKGTELFGFSNRKRISQNNKTFPYEEGYITSSDVYAVTSKIARNGKSIPWVLKLENKDGISIITKGELYDLIQQPNPRQTREQFVEMALLFLLLSGEDFQYSIIPDAMKVPGEVQLLNPQLVDIKVGKFGTTYFPKKYRFETDTKLEPG